MAMKKLHSIGFIMAFFLFGLSCKKETSSFQSYLKFNLDGVPIVCDSIYPSFLHKPDHSFEVTGRWTGGTIELELYDDSLLSTRTYSFHKDEVRRGNLWVDVGPGRQDIYVAGGGFGAFYGPGHITISEVRDHFIRGSFGFESGIGSINSNDSFKIVTNGEFQIQRR